MAVAQQVEPRIFYSPPGSTEWRLITGGPDGRFAALEHLGGEVWFVSDGDSAASFELVGRDP